MELDRYLSFLTRRLPRAKGMARVIKPIRAHFAKKYDSRPDRWVIIDDYDRDIKMRLDRSSYMGGSIYWLGYHHWREMDYLRNNLTSAMTFIDVGANQGEFTLLAAKYVQDGSVFSFEPQDEMFCHLQSNIKLNSYKNVHCFNHGLGAEGGTVSLYTSEDAALHGGVHEGLFTSYPSDCRGKCVQKIQIKPLDEVMKEHKVNRVDFIKIDVEGAELPVLQGAEEIISVFKPKLILELNEETFRNAGYSTNDLIGFLKNHDYRAYKFLWGGRLKEIDLEKANFPSSSFNVLFQ